MPLISVTLKFVTHDMKKSCTDFWVECYTEWHHFHSKTISCFHPGITTLPVDRNI